MQNKAYRFLTSKSFVERLLWTIAILAVIAVYFRWFNFHIFSYGDWSYKYPSNVLSLFSPSTWTSNSDFGSANEFLWRAPFDFLFGLFAFFHLGMNVSEKFLVFMPIAITSLVAPYFLVKTVTRNKIAALVSAIFYSTNTYFLAINPQGHVLLPLAANWLTISFTLFILAIRKNQMNYYVMTALMLWVTGITDFRLFYIGVILFVLYGIYSWFYLGQKISLKKIGVFSVLTMLLQASWLVVFPVVQGAGGGDSMLSRALFGDAFWTLPSALALHHPFWTNTSTTWFIVNDVPIFFYIVPAFACIALVYARKVPFALFFGVLSILGILLSKQTSEPFTDLYPLLYKNLPGFNAFRESTKFYYLILLGYTTLLGILVVYFSKKDALKKLYPFLIATIVIVSLINVKPNLTGSIDKLFTPRSVPGDYARIEQVLKSDKEFYRTMWAPVPSKWSYYDSQHPRTSLLKFSQLPLYGNDFVDTSQSFNLNEAQKIFESPMFERYLQTTSTKYIFVPARDVGDNFFQFYGDDRQFYIDSLSKMPFLHRVNLNTKDVIVFENKSYMPHVAALTNVFSVDDTANLNDLESFPNSRLNGAFNFIYRKDYVKDLTNTTQLADMFGDINNRDLTKEGIVKKIKDVNLYIYPPKPQISFTIDAAKNLTLKAGYDKGVRVSQNVALPDRTLSNIKLNDSKQYYLKVDDSIFAVGDKPTRRFVGTASKNVQILSTNEKNLIANGNFDKGPWKRDVEDCTQGTDNPGVYMSVVSKSERAASDKILGLSALNHIACTTSNSFDVVAGQSYLLKFDYQFITSNRLSYELLFNNGEKWVIDRPGISGTPDWRSLKQSIIIPKGASSMSVRLRSLPVANINNLPNSGIVNFNSVVMTASNVEFSTDINSGTPIRSKAGASTIYESSVINNANLIKNASFEEGGWQKNVDVCDQFKQKPKVGMQIINEASDGKKALLLKTKSRSACIGPELINVQEGGNYLLSFDYMASNTSVASYILSFDDPERTVINESVNAKGSWQHYAKTIHAPVGASNMQLKVYARPGQAGTGEVKNMYDNFSLKVVPDAADQAMAVANSKEMRAPRIDFSSKTSTRKVVYITGANTPFFLAYSESFNTFWRLQTLKGTIIDGPAHFKLNAFENGWYIDPGEICKVEGIDCSKDVNGDYDIRLRIVFTPQQKYQTGTLITVSTLIAASAYLTYRQVYKKKNPLLKRRRIYRVKS